MLAVVAHGMIGVMVGVLVVLMAGFVGVAVMIVIMGRHGIHARGVILMRRLCI